MDIKVIVATHRPCAVSTDPLYIPLQVGAAGKESIGLRRDDTGENISEKNPFFCELTGLYWAWKNLSAEYIGLVHYRRYFAGRRRSAHMCNMLILRREHLDAYCTWLFDILFELEKRIDATRYTPFQARFFGRISELLLDVWLEQNPLDYTTLPVAYIGRVRWDRKGRAFLAAKFLGRKYEKSL